MKITAKKLGQIAFKKGLKRRPSMDPALMKMLNERIYSDDEVDTQILLLDWLNGWDSENLKEMK
jgi:hypothetical protein